MTLVGHHRAPIKKSNFVKSQKFQMINLRESDFLYEGFLSRA